MADFHYTQRIDGVEKSGKLTADFATIMCLGNGMMQFATWHQQVP